LIPSLFPGAKQPGRGADHPPHPAPRLKKEYSYNSPPSGLSWTTWVVWKCLCLDHRWQHYRQDFFS